MRTYTFTISKDEWISSNGRYHHMVLANRVRLLREGAYWAAKGDTPIPHPVHVTAEIGYPTARRADPPNAYPTVKALIDGLIDAQILPDDNSNIITKTSFTRSEIRAPKNCHTITIHIESKQP